MLLRDFRILDNVQILSESKSEGTMKIRGLFQRADEVNQNKRKYPKKVLENSIKSLEPMIKENRLCGELDHPSYEIVKLSNVSHMITDLKMQGNDVIGEATILNTPAGQVAQQLIKGGVKIGISSRGMGTVKEGKGGVSEVNDDYKMITLDLVADPSVHDAFPTLAEGVEPQSDKVEATMKRVYGEKIFIKMLENKLKGYTDHDKLSKKVLQKPSRYSKDRQKYEIGKVKRDAERRNAERQKKMGEAVKALIALEANDLHPDIQNNPHYQAARRLKEPKPEKSSQQKRRQYTQQSRRAF